MQRGPVAAAPPLPSGSRRCPPGRRGRGTPFWGERDRGAGDPGRQAGEGPGAGGKRGRRGVRGGVGCALRGRPAPCGGGRGAARASPPALLRPPRSPRLPPPRRGEGLSRRPSPGEHGSAKLNIFGPPSPLSGSDKPPFPPFPPRCVVPRRGGKGTAALPGGQRRGEPTGGRSPRGGGAQGGLLPRGSGSRRGQSAGQSRNLWWVLCSEGVIQRVRSKYVTCDRSEQNPSLCVSG